MVYAAGIVLYTPSEANVENIQQLIKAGIFEIVTIYDNSSQNNQGLFDAAVIDGNSVNYVYPGKNNALSIPYNQFIERCVEKNIDYLCIFDQDSAYPVHEIKKMMTFIDQNTEQLQEYAVLAPRSYATEDPGKERKNIVTDVDWVINSGTFLNISFLQEKKLRYDENVFLDGLDFDFCWSVRELGGKVGIYEDSILVQALGTPSQRKGSKWCCHSAFRYYLIAKNKKYVWKKHKGVKGTLMAFGSNMRLLGKVLLFEENRWTKFKACLKGMVQ